VGIQLRRMFILVWGLGGSIQAQSACGCNSPAQRSSNFHSPSGVCSLSANRELGVGRVVLRFVADPLPSFRRAPARLIAENAGVEGEVIVEKVVGLPFEYGYNAMVDEVQDLIAAGVLDPAKVTRSGLTNACGIAGIMLTTQVASALGAEHPMYSCQTGTQCLASNAK
jgi:TCP-1/cpn60 chaperonin family